MIQSPARQQLFARLIGVLVLAFSAWMVVQGHARGAVEVGVRHKSVLLSGAHLWLGYLFWFLTACVTAFLFFIENVRSKAYVVLAAVAGVAWLVTLALCLLVGTRVPDGIAFLS